MDNKSQENDKNKMVANQEFPNSFLSHKFHPLEYSSTESLEADNDYKIVTQEDQVLNQRKMNKYFLSNSMGQLQLCVIQR